MVETTNSFFALCADVPWIGNFFFSSWVLKLIGPKTSDKSGVGMMMGVAQKVVSDRFGPDAVDRKDMLVCTLCWMRDPQ
jgi:hypothetical protein